MWKLICAFLVGAVALAGCVQSNSTASASPSVGYVSVPSPSPAGMNLSFVDGYGQNFDQVDNWSSELQNTGDVNSSVLDRAGP